MSARKQKSTPKYGLKEKAAAYVLGLASIVPMPNNPALTHVDGVQYQAHVETAPDTENHTVVAASYKNDIQEDQTQLSAVVSVESQTANTSTEAQIEVQAQPEPETPVTQGDGAVWDRLAECESGGNWQINTGNGYYGGIQFSQASWNAVGGQGLPSDATREEQIVRGQLLQERGGWGNWPACSAQLGLL